MGSLLLVVVASVVATFWVRGVRRNRERWLRRLALPGSWQAEEGEEHRLEFTGGPARGDYRSVRDPDTAPAPSVEHGRWQLRGHNLILTPDGPNEERVLDLRFFESGKIGLQAEHEGARVYRKQATNVVPLQKRS